MISFDTVLRKMAVNPNSYSLRLDEANAIQWAIREIDFLRKAEQDKAVQIPILQNEVKRLEEVYRREREAHAANLKEQQKCEAEIERLVAYQQYTCERHAEEVKKGGECCWCQIERLRAALERISNAGADPGGYLSEKLARIAREALWGVK